MRALVLALLLASCATTGQRSPDLTVEVSSMNWYAKWLAVYCTPDDRLGRIYGIEMGGSYRRSIRLGNCTEVIFAVTAIDGSVHVMREHTVSVGPGERVCVEIATAIRHSRAWNCTKRARP